MNANGVAPFAPSENASVAFAVEIAKAFLNYCGGKQSFSRLSAKSFKQMDFINRQLRFESSLWLGMISPAAFDPLAELFHRPRNLLAIRDGQGFVFHRVSLSEELVITKLGLGRAVADDPPQQSELILILPADQAFHFRCEVPAKAVSRIQDYLGLELARLTPFDSDTVHWSWIKKQDPNGDGACTVDVYVVLQRTIDSAIGLVVPALQKPSGLLLLNADQRFLPLVIGLEGELYGTARRRNWRNAALVGFALLLVCVAFFLSALWSYEGVVQTGLEQAITVAESGARKVKKELDSRQRDRAIKMARADLLASSQMRIGVIEKLSKILPDNTYLTNLSNDDNSVTVEGESAAPEGLVPLLENAGFAHEVSFAAPIVQNAGDSKSHFILKFKIGETKP